MSKSRLREFNPVGEMYGVMEADNPRSAYIVTDSAVDIRR